MRKFSLFNLSSLLLPGIKFMFRFLFPSSLFWNTVTYKRAFSPDRIEQLSSTNLESIFHVYSPPSGEQREIVSSLQYFRTSVDDADVSNFFPNRFAPIILTFISTFLALIFQRSIFLRITSLALKDIRSRGAIRDTYLILLSDSFSLPTWPLEREREENNHREN